MASQHPNQLRDFHAEIKDILSQKDPTFKPSFAAMWVDNLPEETALVKQDPCMEFKCPRTTCKYM